MQQNVRQRRPYYTEDQYRMAREGCSPLEYAMRRGYPLVRDGRFYHMRDHDSMIFTPDGRWFWNSRGLQGRAIEFVMAYEDMTLPEAVLALVGAEGQSYADVKAGRQIVRVAPPAPPIPFLEPERKKQPFELPGQADSFKRLFGYLCGTRKLDSDILRDLIRQGSLYESCHTYKVGNQLKQIHNAVFVGKDAAGQPRSAFQRGLASLGESTTFKRDAPGSDPSAAFCLPGRKEVSRVVVFEAAIDAISHASIFKDAGLDYQDCDRIALGGTEKIQGLLSYLDTHPGIQEVSIATDEDNGGRNAERKISEILLKRGFPLDRVLSVRQSVGKDWNEYLVRWRQVAEQATEFPTTAVRGEGDKPAGRLHYLSQSGKVIATESYRDRRMLEQDIRICLTGGFRIVAETPAQQERIQQSRRERQPAKAPPRELTEGDEMAL